MKLHSKSDRRSDRGDLLLKRGSIANNILKFKNINIMAKNDENLLVKGARGNVRKQYVYKKRGNSTHIARMPVVNKDAVPIEKQSEVRELFGEASLYARGAMSSPDLKKQYQKKATDGSTALMSPFAIF
jgi:hypothetical protein